MPEPDSESWQWYSVETPSVFREYRLPENMTQEHYRQYAELQQLAELHQAPITCTSYRRG